MKKPCSNCPFRKDVKPYLHPERGVELAQHAWNPYNSFTCHKTLGEDDEGDTMVVSTSRECAGFRTLQATEHGNSDEDFTPSYDLVYNDMWEMIDAYSR